ncbi:DsbA family protein [Nitratiruptor tergarcus]|uniref:Protein-disulfide isomerase n=1 Tax=Nitratiruptor tergarcus DSM 16512 TaxID=1069081 RepID=A0A1W1WUU0_9BACT|nr:thioredoxin domain-containing protein [Nitratiruptor tergarcus]SMC09800.1 Protein-disulfide isomerase [Nitratiruptor tergarcus DSM 16512]
MSLMWRLLSISVALSLSLSAATDKDVIKFVKRGLSQNPDLKVYDVKIIEKQPVRRLKGWDAYIIAFNIGIKRGDSEQNLSQRDTIFVKDRFVAPDLVDIKTNRSLKERIVLSLDKSFYDEKHHIFGNKDAKHKLVVFSDPLCPFCREVVPELFEVAKKYPDIFALYYYHLPIQSLHPASVPLAKAIIYLKKQGKKDIIEKIYKTEFNYEEHDESKVLEELDKKLGVKLTTKQINQPWVLQELNEDRKKSQYLMIHGTPTLFVDGKYDPKREAYKKFIPKNKKEVKSKK